mgnify:CR=1 FL=1
MQQLQVKILDERMRDQLPAYGTPGSAGLDLRACIDDAIEILKKILMTSQGLGIANYASGINITLKDFVLLAKELSNSKSVNKIAKASTVLHNFSEWVFLKLSNRILFRKRLIKNII